MHRPQGTHMLGWQKCAMRMDWGLCVIRRNSKMWDSKIIINWMQNEYIYASRALTFKVSRTCWIRPPFNDRVNTSLTSIEPIKRTQYYLAEFLRDSRWRKKRCELIQRSDPNRWISSLLSFIIHIIHDKCNKIEREIQLNRNSNVFEAVNQMGKLSPIICEHYKLHSYAGYR